MCSRLNHAQGQSDNQGVTGRRLVGEQAAAEVFELSEQETSRGAGYTGLPYGGDTEAGGGKAGDIAAEGAVKLRALPLVLFAQAGFGRGVAAGAERTGFTVNAPAFLERPHGTELARGGELVQAREAGMESHADPIVFEEKSFLASSRHWRPFAKSLCRVLDPGSDSA